MCYGNQGSRLGVLYEFPLYFLWDTVSRCTSLERLCDHQVLWGPPVSTSPVLRLQMAPMTLSTVQQGLNSGPHACIASILCTSMCLPTWTIYTGTRNSDPGSHVCFINWVISPALTRFLKQFGGGGNQLQWHTSVMPRNSVLGKPRQVDREREAILDTLKIEIQFQLQSGTV